MRGKNKVSNCRKRNPFTSTHPGIDGILVTVGLCIIALVLCVFLRDQLGIFLGTIIGDMTKKAEEILSGGVGGAIIQ